MRKARADLIPLRKCQEIWVLANDLRLRFKDDPVVAISRYCRKRVAEIAAQTNSRTPQELLELVATDLKTKFVEIHRDEDLAALQREMAAKEGAEFAVFLHLAPDDLGVTVKRAKHAAWEFPFLSVIDCRGWKAAAAYFTKWHELAHLLTLTSQRRLVFHRSRVTDPVAPKPAEERLMDRLAGELGFLDELVRPHIGSVDQFSFAAAETLRRNICPAASKQSWLMGLVRAWPTPVLMITASVRLKPSETTDQLGLFGAEVPVEKLRVDKTLPNTAARECGLTVFENWRVPEQSAIQSLFSDDARMTASAVECLSWWGTSSGTRRPAMKIRIEARRYGAEVEVLITPFDLASS